jgi:hypothetical protein
MSWAMCAERWRLVCAPAWRIAAKAPATSAITSSTEVELGRRERAFHGDVLGARGQHRRQLREQGCRGIAGDKVAVRSSVRGTGTPDGGPHPMLFEIFRVEDGRLAEMWGVTEGPHLIWP